MSSKNVLVTGGTGYIGTHTCIELLAAGYTVTIFDNLDNSSEVALERVRELSGCKQDDLKLVVGDLLDMASLAKLFKQSGPFCACIHLAGFKAVGESVKLPLHYYANNVTGTVNLLSMLKKHNVHNFVFSSSATVYGDPQFVPITEEHPLGCVNPYGKTKLHIEEMLRDLDQSDNGKWRIAILRYFNPIGAHPSGRIGEDPKGIPNNLVPFVSQVAVGRRDKLMVFGNDYDTPDGTGVRDYLHVVDLAKAHVAATKKVLNTKNLGAVAYNLGSGQGSSVLQVVAAFEKACGKKIPYEITARRPGDATTCYANPQKAGKELNWKAELSVEQACIDGWNWQQKNPNGFRESAEQEDGERKALVFQLFE